MNLEKEKISDQQLVFLLCGFMQGSALLTTYVESLITHDSWMAALLGFAAIIPFVLVYSSIIKSFPGMNLIEIHDVVYGTYIGKIISILYIFYFFLLLSFNIRFMSDVYITFLMPETPMNFFLVAFTLTSAYVVWKGIEVLTRIGHWFVSVFFLILIGTSLLLLPKYDFSNFLPFFEAPPIKLIQSIHITLGVPYGEIVIFLAFASSLNSTKHTAKNMLTGLSLGAISYIIPVARNIAVLGLTQGMLASPSFQAARLIEVGNIFNRMDILIGIGQTLLIYLKTSVIYYVVVASLSQLFRLKTYVPLIIPVGGIGVVLAATNWHSSAEAQKQALSISPVFITPFILIFPLLTLLTAKLRGFKGNKRREKQ